jgi:hypothetical protein
MGYELTDEQQAIVSSDARNLLITAFAGTGKTSTLVEYAKARPRERMTYLAFNRAIKEDAARKFPSNVRCVTTHGLAFPSFGQTYKEKLGNPKPYHLTQRLSVTMSLAGLALGALNNWLVSADPQMTEHHVRRGSPVPVGEHDIAPAIDTARRAWAAMQDIADHTMPMPHDGYLKLYQLSGKKISTDRILFDECQDSNPVTQGIVAAQACGKVYVGDSRQAIYGFRGATNTMRHIQADARLHLTHSFRFGQGVADIANEVLGAYEEHPFPIHGKGVHQTVFGVDRNAPHTLLSRTNAMLFVESVNALNRKVPFGFVGGVENYKFDIILDAYYLKTQQPGMVRDRFIQSFPAFSEMEAYAEGLDDKELKFLVRIIKDYGSDVPVLVTRIRNEAVVTPTGNEVLLTTGHKAKGLEWMNVVLSEDFTDMRAEYDAESKADVPPPREEVNLLYVAMTRAMKGLAVHTPLVDWLTGESPDIARRISRDTDVVATAAAAEQRSRQATATSSVPERRKDTPPPPSTSGMRQGQAWTEGEEANVIALWKFSKLDAHTIAGQIKRTPGAVIARLSKTLSRPSEEIELENDRRRGSR